MTLFAKNVCLLDYLSSTLVLSDGRRNGQQVLSDGIQWYVTPDVDSQTVKRPYSLVNTYVS
jgi:hypothetical protein